MKEGVVLLAHGSRDPEWSRPFEQLALSVGKRMPAVAVAMAYLEHGASLEEGIAALAARGALSVRIVPVFLGQGGHARGELPQLFARAAQAFPELKLSLDQTVGERASVIEAIAEVICAPR